VPSGPGAAEKPVPIVAAASLAGFSGFAAPAAPVKNIVLVDGGWARIGSQTRQSRSPARTDEDIAQGIVGRRMTPGRRSLADRQQATR